MAVNNSVWNSSQNASSLQNKNLGINTVAVLDKATSAGNEETTDSNLRWITSVWSIVGGVLVLLVSGTVAWVVSRRHHSLTSDSGGENKKDIEKGLDVAIALPDAELVAPEDCQDKVSGSTRTVEDTDSVEFVVEVADGCSSCDIVVDLTTAKGQCFSQVEHDKVAKQTQDQKKEDASPERLGFEFPAKRKQDEASPAVSTSSSTTMLAALEPLRADEDETNKKAEDEDGLAPELALAEELGVALAVPAERFGFSPIPRDFSSQEATCEPKGWPVFPFPRNWFATSCAKPTPEEIQNISAISRAPSLMDTQEPSEQKRPDMQEPYQIADAEQQLRRHSVEL